MANERGNAADPTESGRTGDWAVLVRYEMIPDCIKRAGVTATPDGPSRPGVGERGAEAPEPVFAGFGVDKRPETVENRGPLWTSGPSRHRQTLGSTWIKSGSGAWLRGPSRAVHRDIHRPDHESAIRLHRHARLVHCGRPHGDEGLSTASTP